MPQDTGLVWKKCDCHQHQVIEVPCGCGQGHMARLYRDHVVHWRGKHWNVQCAFAQAASDLAALTGERPQLECPLPETPEAPALPSPSA